mgnify:CR=1 FL=1
MTGQSGEVYILFTNVRDINYANIIFNPNLLSQHQSVELSLHLIQSVHITDYLILYFLNYLDWSFLFRQESRARGLADNQEEKYIFFYLISIICCLQHWNIILICSWKKCFNILLSFLYFYDSKISTITRKVPRVRNWGFFLKIIFSMSSPDFSLSKFDTRTSLEVFISFIRDMMGTEATEMQRTTSLVFFKNLFGSSSLIISTVQCKQKQFAFSLLPDVFQYGREAQSQSCQKKKGVEDLLSHTPHVWKNKTKDWALVHERELSVFWIRSLYMV